MNVTIRRYKRTKWVSYPGRRLKNTPNISTIFMELVDTSDESTILEL